MKVFIYDRTEIKKNLRKKKKKRTIRSYKFNVVYFYKEIIDQSHNKRKKKKNVDVNGVKDVLSCESIHIMEMYYCQVLITY